MKVVTINQLLGTKREVEGKGFISIRPVLERDNMGYSIHKTIIPKGKPEHWHYTNHLETCYCIEGKGILTDLTTGETYEIVPDTVYLLNKNDDHTFQAIEDTVLISVFNPPCEGDEVHKPDGSY